MGMADSGIHAGQGLPQFKSYTISPGNTNGTFFTAGFYDTPDADTNRTEAAPTQTFGGAGETHASHAILVAAGAGTATGGSSGTVSIVVSGVSITDAGVKNDADTETIVADVTEMATDQYFETTKKWLGIITYTLTDDGDRTAFTAVFNYGLAKYDDWGNRNFTITDFECTGQGGATDGTLDFELLHHNATDWTYSAAAFVPGAQNSSIVKMTDDHGANDNTNSNDTFAYKRAGLTRNIQGSADEGFVVRATSSVNNSLRYINVHVGALIA